MLVSIAVAGVPLSGPRLELPPELRVPLLDTALVALNLFKLVKEQNGDDSTLFIK